MDRLDGTVYAAYERIGEYLFEVTKAVKGMTADGCLSHEAGDTQVDWQPDETGRLEAM
jgi:hypothetical protein